VKCSEVFENRILSKELCLGLPDIATSITVFGTVRGKKCAAVTIKASKVLKQSNEHNYLILCACIYEVRHC
jgi:hypothetical protein